MKRHWKLAKEGRFIHVFHGDVEITNKCVEACDYPWDNYAIVYQYTRAATIFVNPHTGEPYTTRLDGNITFVVHPSQEDYDAGNPTAVHTKTTHVVDKQLTDISTGYVGSLDSFDQDVVDIFVTDHTRRRKGRRSPS